MLTALQITITAALMQLQPLPEGYESSAFKTLMWVVGALFAAVAALVGWAFKAVREDTKAMDTRHNETLRLTSENSSKTIMAMSSEHRTALTQISNDHRLAVDKLSESLDGFAQVQSKSNSIALARLPIETQNEINRIHPEKSNVR